MCVHTRVQGANSSLSRLPRCDAAEALWPASGRGKEPGISPDRPRGKPQPLPSASQCSSFPHQGPPVKSRSTFAWATARGASQVMAGARRHWI